MKLKKRKIGYYDYVFGKYNNTRELRVLHGYYKSNMYQCYMDDGIIQGIFLTFPFNYNYPDVTYEFCC